ncbi:response regulator transcription factor [Asticcacaulis sp.]|uniref:response regulator transcription factor n=1 Tax=Asticcacaulis sp. TaxID=1872648 RepID=UPI0031DBAFFC
MRVLIVEDDPMIGQSLKLSLSQSGYRADWVKDGDAADEALRTEAADIILLDMGLPRRGGMDVLRDLRKRGDRTPVLVITARDALSDRVAGLDAGADDYLVKPFELEELEARIRALIRRREGRTETVLRHGDLVLDPTERRVERAGEGVTLTAREYALLLVLMTKGQAVSSVSELEEQVYGWNEEVESNAIEVLIYQLRRKLGKGFVRNVRGMGYQLGAA